MKAVEYEVRREDGSVFFTRSYREAHSEGNEVVKIHLIPIKD